MHSASGSPFDSACWYLGELRDPSLHLGGPLLDEPVGVEDEDVARRRVFPFPADGPIGIYDQIAAGSGRGQGTPPRHAERWR